MFSADAYLEGLEKIKKEVQKTGQLNRAYVPILQGINPGEIQKCRNAQNFSHMLVSNWLCTHKFRRWKHHSANGKSVTDREKKARARKIAKRLCQHSRWLTHGRSLKIKDLEKIELKITDYSKTPELQDAIKRYYTLMRMTFETTSIYKIFETPVSQIYRYVPLPAPAKPQLSQGKTGVIMIEFQCPKCNNVLKFQANMGQSRPLQEGALPFPENNLVICPSCGTQSNVGNIRNQIEAQTKQKIVK